MNFLHSIILGAVEGFTEFLPISSTAHIILTSRILGFAESEFLKTFTIVIQFGAILAVVALYWRTFLKDWETVKRIIVAFIPTAIIGFGLYKIIKGFFLVYIPLILASLFIGGAFLIVFEVFYKKSPMSKNASEIISYKKAFLIGLAQSLAVIPGVSRAAATIIGGLLLGIERKTIVEFSFLLAAPTMAAAAGYDFLKNFSEFSTNQFDTLMVGFLASFIFAMLGIKFLLNYIGKKSFAGFGVYRIILAVLFFFLLMI